MPFAENLLTQRFSALIMAAFVSLIISWIAWINGFFRLSFQKHVDKGSISWRHVFGVFGIFLATESLIAPTFYLIWKAFKEGAFVMSKATPIDVETQGWLNLFAIFCALVAVRAFYGCLAKDSQNEIRFNRDTKKNSSHAIADLLIGASTWFIAYPWIVVISLIMQLIFQDPHVDQVAVRHLKGTITHPLLLSVTVFSVIVFVPFIEELLFRGFLQSWLKETFSRSKAIILTSIVFAFFHFSFSQGIGNLELLFSLFILSCFLGFLRERQCSLWASIGLHGMFNLVSISMILISPVIA